MSQNMGKEMSQWHHLVDLILNLLVHVVPLLFFHIHFLVLFLLHIHVQVLGDVQVHVHENGCGFKGWGQNAKLGPHSAIWGKLGTALQAYALNPCTKFPPNPTSRKVNT